MGTGKEQKIRITASSGLTGDEVDKMVQDAEAHAAEDRKQREIIDMRNQADAVIYSVEKTLHDYGEKISFDDRADINKKLDDLKAKKGGSDAMAIKQAIDDLQQAVYKLSEAVYRDAAQAQAGAGQTAPPQEPPKPEPEDAGSKQSDSGTEYRVVDEEEDKG
jgi:molecular chaperone DnaK